jgi:hypothetical protein
MLAVMSRSVAIPLGEGLWTFPHREFSVKGLRIGTRTNLFCLADGSLALHSPGPLDADALASIRALGDVSVILAPSLLHHFFLADVCNSFPGAAVLASPGLAAKARAVRVDRELGSVAPELLAGVAEMLPLDGCPKLEERVFFHPASRTLVAVDLAFHLWGMRGWTKFVMWLNGANNRFAVTRIARRQFIEDPQAAGRSVARMIDAWDFDRIVVSHGEVVERGGREALRAAWAWTGVL